MQPGPEILYATPTSERAPRRDDSHHGGRLGAMWFGIPVGFLMFGGLTMGFLYDF